MTTSNEKRTVPSDIDIKKLGVEHGVAAQMPHGIAWYGAGAGGDHVAFARALLVKYGVVVDSNCECQHAETASLDTQRATRDLCMKAAAGHAIGLKWSTSDPWAVGYAAARKDAAEAIRREVI